MNEFLKRLNTKGIPAIESIGITSNGSTTTITFKNHPYVSSYFAGGFWVKISQSLVSGSNVIQFATNGVSGSEMPLYLSTGDQATAANLVSNGTGIHLCFYDRDTNRLQLIA